MNVTENNVIEDNETAVCDEDFFIYNADAPRDGFPTITEEQARQFLEGFDSPERNPTPALIAAFERRKRNQEKSSWSGHASRD